MKDPGPVSVREVSTIETSSNHNTSRKGPFAWLLEALYVSRRRETRRVIRRYRHLIAEDFSGRPRIVAIQASESRANADRDKTLLRAVDRAIENA
jgi:hypothetical protein